MQKERKKRLAGKRLARKLSAFSLKLFLLPFTFHFSLSSGSAAVPQWWMTRGVINTNLPSDNYGPVNVGQLKHVAFQAALELEEKLPNGAGDCWDLVESFSKTNGNYAPVNQGQLKYIAQFFYDRLIQEGYTNSYPWTETKADDANFALINQGQLKFVFSFDLDKWKPKPPNWVDEDGDGLDDGVEVVLWGDLDQQGADDDADGDGVSNGQEAQDGMDPLDPNPPPNPDDIPSYAVVDFGLEGMGLKVNEVGDLVGRQGASYFTVHKAEVEYWPADYRVEDLNEEGDILLCPKQGDMDAKIVSLESGEEIELGEWNSPKAPEAILQDPHMLSYSYQGLKSKRAYAMNDSQQCFGYAYAKWQYTYWYYDEYQNYKEATANYSEAIPMFWTPQVGMKIAFAAEYQFWMDGQQGFSINAQGAFVAGWYAHVKENKTVDNCQYWASAGASAQFLGALDAGFSINNQNQIAGQKKDWARLVGAGGGGGFVLGGGYATSVNDKEQTLINDSQGNASMFRKNPDTQNYEKFPVTQTLPDDSGWQIALANDINNDGAIAGQGIKEGDMRAVAMVPLEITNLWSDQLPDVHANWIQKAKDKNQMYMTGQDSKPYILMGARADGKAYVKAALKDKLPKNFENALLFRLSVKGQNDPKSGTSSYNADKQEVSITAEDLGNEEKDYVVVAGYDANKNAQLDPNEISFKNDWVCKVVPKEKYDKDIGFLNTWKAGLGATPLAYDCVTAFLEETTPNGSTAVNTEIARNEYGLTHAVGILFQPVAQPGPSIKAIFDENSLMAEKIIDSSALKNWLNEQFELKKSYVQQTLNNTTNEVVQFNWQLPPLDVNFSYILDTDLKLSLGSISSSKKPVHVKIIVNVASGKTIEVKMTGTLNDLYDFDYDGEPFVFVKPAARIQSGYNTLGKAGRVYKSEIQLVDSLWPREFNFK